VLELSSDALARSPREYLEVSESAESLWVRRVGVQCRRLSEAFCALFAGPWYNRPGNDVRFVKVAIGELRYYDESNRCKGVVVRAASVR
jgi:hypothetical protein